MDRALTVDRFRERLQQLIRDSGLKQSAFAARVGIDRSTLSQILSNTGQRLPRVETLTAIAASEQVSLDWLLGLSDVGDARANLMQQIEISPGGLSPGDDRLIEWHAEAKGYKIRHVPQTIPDVLKTAEVIEYEYARYEARSPEQQIEQASMRLAYQRLPETDMEVCSSVDSVYTFALGQGRWRGLDAAVRRRQVEAIIRLCDELYPRFRWFLFDSRRFYSAPLTVFGPLRAVIYIGQMYVVLTGREQIDLLIGHFDGLIRNARVNPPELGAHLQKALDLIE